VEEEEGVALVECTAANIVVDRLEHTVEVELGVEA
jgi:hypothetical protein